MTFLQLAGESPICPVSLRTRVIAFLPLFIRMAWCSLRVSWESSQTPSHLVASSLNWTLLSPTATVALEVVLFWWKSAASVLPWSNAIPFLAAHAAEAVATSDSLAADRPRESHGAYVRPVRVVHPFHPMRVWLFRCDYLPLLPLLITLHRLVGRGVMSMMIPGLARRSAAMCLLAWRA